MHHVQWQPGSAHLAHPVRAHGWVVYLWDGPHPCACAGWLSVQVQTEAAFGHGEWLAYEAAPQACQVPCRYNRATQPHAACLGC